MQNNVETHIGDNSDHGQGLVNKPYVICHQVLMKCP